MFLLHSAQLKGPQLFFCGNKLNHMETQTKMSTEKVLNRLPFLSSFFTLSALMLKCSLLRMSSTF